jgi:HlyD family secretion protein
MKNKIFFIIIVLSSLILAGLIYPDRDKKDGPKIEAAKQSFTIEVNTIGELDAAGAHMVTSSVRGTAGKIMELVEDGTRVKKGDILVRLDKTPFEEELQLLRGEINKLRAAESAKEQLVQWEKSRIEKELKTADYHINKAEIEFSKYTQGEGPLMLIQLKEEIEKIELERSKFQSYLADLLKLKQDGFDYPSEIFKARQEIAAIEDKFKGANRKHQSYNDHVYPSLVREYQANIEQGKMEKEQIEKAGTHKLAKAGSDLDEVRAGIENLLNKLKNAENQIQKTDIYAPSNGIVILYETYRDGQKRKPRIGDTVLMTQPVLYLPDISSMVVKTKIREVDLYKVKTGRHCTVRVDAYPEKKLEGRVSFIGALASDKLGGNPGVKYFRMIVEITTQDSDLRPGMTARINIVTKKINNAVCVPLYSIFEDETGAYCYKDSDKGVERVKVEIGDSNENFVVILSGLKEGDTVIPIPF